MLTVVICECKLVDFEKDGGTKADDDSFDTVWKNGAAINTSLEGCSLHRASWLCASHEQNLLHPALGLIQDRLQGPA